MRCPSGEAAAEASAPCTLQGKISFKNLKRVAKELGENMTDEELQEMIDEADRDGAALSLPALFVAPVAARWSARAPLVLLRRLFALCLVAIAFRLLLRL